MTASEGPAPQPRDAGPSDRAATKLLDPPQRTGGQGHLLPLALPDVETATALADRIRRRLAQRLDDQAVAEEIVDSLAQVILDAACWRYWWHPEVHAARLAAEVDAARRLDDDEAELDAQGWTPTLTREQRAYYARTRPSLAELAERRGEPERAARARERARHFDLSVVPDAG